jgi:PAS domain S-box-containing protein
VSAARAKPLRLRSQLLLGSAGVSLITALTGSLALSVLESHRIGTALEARGAIYAALLQQQLESVVAFRDQLTAREVFNSFSSDPEVLGLGVYTSTGSLIEGKGSCPQRWSDAEQAQPLPDRLVLLAPIRSREGPRGHLYVSIATRQIQGQQRAAAWTGAAIALLTVILGLLFARQVTRRLADRLAGIAAAAKQISFGDVDHHELSALTNEDGDDEIGDLARALRLTLSELRQLFEERRQLALTQNSQLEELVTARTRELAYSREQYRLIAESTNAIPFALDLQRGGFDYLGPRAVSLLGYAEHEWRATRFLDRLLDGERGLAVKLRFEQALEGSFEVECPIATAAGDRIEVRWVVSRESVEGRRHLRGLMLDITEQRRLESELSQAQKLESVGRLASGVAHEINTPVQFVSDSTIFIRDALKDLATFVGTYRSQLTLFEQGGDPSAAVSAMKLAESDADLDYILENVPQAIENSLDGLGRIASIVKSMKEFAYPDRKEMAFVDLNQAINSTLTISKHEYKYVADVQMNAGELPPVLCHVSEVNQVLLNLFVNAAHAISERIGGSQDRGVISVSTRLDGAQVEVAIGDTGTGISEAARGHIFEPFFTTKKVGKGTGQGLAIARRVVERHGGSLRFETELGKGTVFFLRLPVQGERLPPALA